MLEYDVRKEGVLRILSYPERMNEERAIQLRLYRILLKYSLEPSRNIDLRVTHLRTTGNRLRLGWLLATIFVPPESDQ